MTRLYVQLQSPSIELTVTAKDAAHTKHTMTVGFKRYEAMEGARRLEELQDLYQAQVGLSAKDADIASIHNFFKEEILYLKQAPLVKEEDGKPKPFIISDTRKVQPLEDVWETPEECLDALLDMFLSSAPWMSSFSKAINSALSNLELEDGSLKNY